MSRPKDEAKAWLKANAPAELKTFPSDRTGRDDRELPTADPEHAYFERNQGERPALKGNPAFRRDEALDEQYHELWTHEPGQPCLHCRDGLIRYSGPGWCNRCYQYAKLHGGRLRPLTK